MAVNPCPLGPKPQIELATGAPAVGGQLFFYLAGSVNTKQDTYTDSTGSVANTNPLVLNSLGQPTTEIWFSEAQSYKVVYAPVGDTDPPSSPIWSIDNLKGINDPTNLADQWVISSLTPTFVGATQFTLPGDRTTTFTVGRRVKCTVTAGTVYGRITVSSYAASVTTVTLVLDGAQALDAGLSVVAYGLLSSENHAWPPTLVQAGTDISITYDSSGRPVIGSSVSHAGRLISETVYGIASATSVSGITFASPAVVSLTYSGSLIVFQNMPIVFSTSGAFPPEIVQGTTYYIASSAGGSGTCSFNISAIPGGAVINTSANSTGTITASSPTYNKATNNPGAIEVELIGPGGGGGGVNATAGAAASGGGGGAYLKAYIPSASIISGNVIVSPGIGGTAGSNAGGNGGNGTNTSLQIITGPSAITAGPGLGGIGSSAASSPKLGGLGGNPTVSTMTGNQNVSVCGGSGQAGGGSISTATVATSYAGFGGGSIMCGAIAPIGWGVTGAGVNAAPSVYGIGAGGSGALGATANVGGTGGSGLIIIREYS